jgi:hypothetical protein
MEPPSPSRVELLLMRAFDGEADADERAELSAWAGSEPRLAELAELRTALREALASPGPCDVAADVMALIAEEDAWASAGGLFTAAFKDDADVPPLDGLADGVLDAIAADDAWAPIGAALSEAVRAEAGTVDVWPAVQEVVDSEPAGWADTSDALRGLFAGAPAVDVADAVMTEVAAASAPQMVDVVPIAAARSFPAWASLGAPFAAVAALAAAFLLAVRVPAPTDVVAVAPQVDTLAAVEPLALANDAQVEELSTGEGALTAQVMQFEDGGPTIIFIEEAEL